MKLQKQNNRKKKTNTIYLTIFIGVIIGLFLVLCIYIYYNNQEHFENENIKNNNGENSKIAFLFLTYTNLKRPDIWNKFFDDKNSNKFTIYNHAKEPEQVTDILLKDRHIPEHINTGWGQFNLVEANILMIKNALEDPLNKKFILVSDSCIPIVSFDTFYNEIMKDSNTIITIHNNINLDRYDKIINPNFPKEEFIKHSGSGLVLNVKHAKLLVSVLDNYKNNWKDVFCADEHYIGNILRVLDTDFIINNNNNNIKTTFDIWRKDKLNINNICNNNNNETICIYNNMYLQSPALINNIRNKMIDELRDKKFLLMRKVDDKTEIDINYLVNS